jgi:hypothetical protein
MQNFRAGINIITSNTDMKFKPMAAMAALCILSGCATCSLPSGAQKVGGGIAIKWSAPENGTAIFMETKSGQIVSTKSLEKGDEFRFEPDYDNGTQVLETLFARPSLPTNMHFVLYFVPEKKTK